MNASKNYQVKDYVRDNDPEIEVILQQHPLWTRRAAKELLARRRFAQAIRKAGEREKKMSANSKIEFPTR